MKKYLSKNSLFLSLLTLGIAFGAGHTSFASNPKSLLDTLPKELHGEIGKYTDSLDKLKILNSSDLKESLIDYNVFRGLTLHLDKVDEETMKLVSKLTNIKNVTVDAAQRKNVNDTTIEHLKGFRNLESIDLDDTSITDKALEYIKDSNVKTIHLVNTNITDACIIHLKKMKNIENLYAHYTHITDAGVAEILPFFTNRFRMTYDNMMNARGTKK